MNATRMALATVLTVALVLASATAWCGRPATGDLKGGILHGPVKQLISGHVGRLLVLKSQIGITDEQKDKIAAVLQKHLDKIVPAATTLLEKRQALREAILKQPADEKAIRAAAQDLTGSVADASVLAARVIAEVRPILTEKQMRLLENFRADAHKATIEWFSQLGK